MITRTDPLFIQIPIPLLPFRAERLSRTVVAIALITECQNPLRLLIPRSLEKFLIKRNHGKIRFPSIPGGFWILRRNPDVRCSVAKENLLFSALPVQNFIFIIRMTHENSFHFIKHRFNLSFR